MATHVTETQKVLTKARTTLVCGAPGCGKALLGTQFLARGALDSDETGTWDLDTIETLFGALGIEA